MIMFYNTAKFAEKKAETPGYYDLYRVPDDGEEAKLEISIPAERIEGTKYGALFAKQEDGTYSLYACPSITEDNQEKFGELRFFIGGILEFEICGPFFIYKTDEGWFFLILTRAFWNIDNDDILEKRRNTIPKIMGRHHKYIGTQGVEDKDGKIVACIVNTMGKNFILFAGDPFSAIDVPKYVYDDEGHQHLNLVPLHGEFLEIYDWNFMDEFNHSIKIYPSSEDEFYIGSLLSIQECKQPEVLYTEIVNQWEAERGRYLAVANKLGEQALLHVVDGCKPRMVTEWSNKTIVMRYQLLSRTKFSLVEGDEITVIFDDVN